MAILSTTHIHINGNELSYYNRCNLHQEIGEHHTLDLQCLLETIQKFCDDNNQQIENLLGTILTIETKSYANLEFHGTLKFKGIITGISYKKGLFSNEGDLVLLKALSPTIIADDGPHYNSYNETSFIDIMTDNFSNYNTSRLKINTKSSKLTEPLLYTVQFNESCFKFAQRMAARHGEWLYYNGEALTFGLDTKTKELELILGRDLHELNTALVPIAQNFNYFTTDYLTDDVHEKDSSSNSKTTDGYFGIVNKTSKDVYANPTKVWLNISDDAQSKSRLDGLVELQQNALQTNQIKIDGTSDNPGVMLAITIKISGNSYIVTKVTHAYSSNGEYENFFEATSANIKTYPKTDISAFPIAHSQTAKVIENNDPDGMGRIKVQFAWQKQHGLTTPWTRIMTPHAGGDKGFHFIPEIDEEVLVDFEGSNAEAPFVMGALYHGNHKPDSWKTDKNDIKAIRTRSGHTFELNDAKGSESITITDMNGNIITIDTANNNITISALENMSLNAKNMQINVEENLDVTVGKDKTESIAENSFITANNEEKQIAEEIKVISSTYKQEAQEITTDASGEIKTNAGGKISIASAETVEYGE